jgi:hypothetical protein
MFWDEEKVLANIRQAETDDLLDRVTAYRLGMEAVAITMTEEELRLRGIRQAEISRHREACERDCLYLPDGTAAMCTYCRKPAVTERWGWHRIWRKIPAFPRRLRLCKEHAGETGQSDVMSSEIDPHRPG